MRIRSTFVLTAIALIAAACGDEPATVAGTITDQPAAATAQDDAAAATAEDDAAAATAEDDAAANAAANQPSLATADDVLDTEVLVVADGSVTTLAEAATGDRPLLVWFWAPH